jgi:hypothetical protein
MYRAWLRNSIVAAVALVASLPAQAPSYGELVQKAESIAPAVQKAIESKAAPEAAGNAQQLGAVMGEIQAFWIEQKNTDAATEAGAAKTAAVEIAAAATTGDFDKASEAWKKLLEAWAKVPRNAS